MRSLALDWLIKEWYTFNGVGKPQALRMAPKTSNDAIAGNGIIPNKE